MEKNAFATLFQFMNRMALFAIAASLMLPVAVSGGQSLEYVPGNSNKGIFVVEDVSSQFAALKHHGEALGWRLPEGAPDPSDPDHYQGIVRYPGDGVPVFYVTQKDNDDPILPGASDKGGYLHVVRFGTRPTTGERLRSNLLAKYSDTEDTYPQGSDTWVPLTQFKGPTRTQFEGAIRFDGSLMIDRDPNDTLPPYTIPAYVHPGGMAIVDDILFVPLDTPRLDTSRKGQIVLFDLRENGGGRENPVPIHAIQLTHGIDNLAVTKYDFGDGEGIKYLVWVNGAGGSVTKFYKTTSSNLRDDDLGLILVHDWKSESDLLYGEWYTDACAHQSSTFLRDQTGLLYMIGMRHAGEPGWMICGSPTVGSDYADLYQVQEHTPGHFMLTYVGERHFYCAYDGGGGPEHMRICNFGAASNAYVSPSGELILYSTPHADENWKSPKFVRLGEFRHRDVNQWGTCTRGTGWAELYDDKNFYDRSIVFDWADRDKDDFNYFNELDRFNDKASSVRWCAPVGCNIILYEHDNYGGDTITLEGSGVVAEVSDLGGFGDEASSIRFDPNSICENSPPIAYAGPDRTVSAGPDCTATLAFDGSVSSDPDGDSLSYTWTWDGGSAAGVNPTITLPLGIHTVTLTVDDGEGGTDSDAIEIKVEDTTPPVMTNVPGSIEVNQTSLEGAQVDIPQPTVEDKCSTPVLQSDAPDVFPLGTTTVTFTATDQVGNTSTASTTVTVVEVDTPGHMHGAGHIDAGGKQQNFAFQVKERADGQDRGWLWYHVRDRGRLGIWFVSTHINAVYFSDDPTVKPGHRWKPKVDTAAFTGVGRFNGVPGYTFYAQATDAGEPGRGRDTFEVMIWDPNDTLVGSISGTLSHGNIESHRIQWFWHPSKGKGVSMIVPHGKGKEKGKK